MLRPYTVVTGSNNEERSTKQKRRRLRRAALQKNSLNGSLAFLKRLRFFVYGDFDGGGDVAENFNRDVLFADYFDRFG